MSQRPSGYQRKEFDRYQTPAWVTNVARAAHSQHNRQKRSPDTDSGIVSGLLDQAGADGPTTNRIAWRRQQRGEKFAVKAAALPCGTNDAAYGAGP